MEKWSVFEEVIIEKLNDIFNGEDINKLSIYEKRKRIYDYLYNSLDFDFEELNNNSKEVNKQITNVLIYNKGICNSIIYVYKIMLEKVGVYGLVLFCKDEDDKHTILLVDNGNGTLSFDDISVAIYSKKRSGNKIGKEDRFDYDLDDAIEMNQGVNAVSGNEKYFALPSKVVNFFFGKEDEEYKVIKPSFVNEEVSFLNYPKYINSFKKQNISLNQKN